jgi:putative glutamine amidotransferase
MVQAIQPRRLLPGHLTFSRMVKFPLILVSGDTEKNGVEMGDVSTSLSERYQHAILDEGGIPVTLPATIDPDRIAECVRRCDGVMLTGGEDLDPRLYRERLSLNLRAKVTVTPDGGRRDYRELLLLKEVFEQRKPLLGICRGHQLVNIALGGTLYADLPTEKPGKIVHRQMEKRCDVVHEVRLTPESMLAKIIGEPTLGVNSTHHQGVARIAPVLQACARSPDGIVEGLELKRETANWLPFLITVQFHPERLADRYPEHRAIFRAFAEACAAAH